MKNVPQPDLCGISLEGDERVDRLCDGLWIIQRARGHRATTDDQLLAWAALDELDRRATQGLPYRVTPTQSILELGAGKGTVTLWLSHALRGACFFGIEAFEGSYLLSLKNRRLNRLEGRFFPLLGDLRSEAKWEELKAARLTHAPEALEGGFDVILGAPPFMPLGTGVLPQDQQRASGRFELRGGVEGYLSAVKACLGAAGFAVILMDGAGERRALEAAQAEGLCVTRLTRVTPRPARPPTYSLLWLAWVTSLERRQACSAPITELAMRETEGEAWSVAYQAVRRRLGL